jgi:transcriptional regulator with XRE-family HTH domain
MSKRTLTYPNELKNRRDQFGFRATPVARLLGYKRATTLANFEQGRRLPTLEAAVKLSILLQTSLESLFPALYAKLREDLRLLQAKRPLRSRDLLQALMRLSHDDP